MKKMMTIVAFVMFVFAVGCTHEFIDLGACTANEDCDDGVPCTVDICGVDKVCVMVPSSDPSCEPSPDCVPTDCISECHAEGMPTGICSSDMCVCLPATECDTSADCDDGDDCTIDLCEVGHICRHTPADDPACAPPECITSDDCGFRDSECIVSRCVMNHCLLAGRDDDIDGHQLCGSPTGEYLGDCDDHDVAVHPGATEICDGKDNDCDGETDEGLEDMGPCGLPSVGECADGHLMCLDGTISCVNAVLPSDEICDDGLDNDCDGETDEDSVCPPAPACTSHPFHSCSSTVTEPRYPADFCSSLFISGPPVFPWVNWVTYGQVVPSECAEDTWCAPMDSSTYEVSVAKFAFMVQIETGVIPRIAFTVLQGDASLDAWLTLHGRVPFSGEWVSIRKEKIVPSGEGSPGDQIVFENIAVPPEVEISYVELSLSGFGADHPELGEIFQFGIMSAGDIDVGHELCFLSGLPMIGSTKVVVAE